MSIHDEPPQSPWGQGPRNEPPRRPGQPPNFEDWIKKGQAQWRSGMPSPFGNKRIFLLVGAGLIFLWLITGLYRVGPGEKGVVMTLGKYSRTTDSGLHYHLPSPLEDVEIVNTEVINRVEIGYRTAGNQNIDNKRVMKTREVIEEGTMLTGDENLVNVPFTLLWKIKDPAQYIFNLREPEITVKRIAESAIREVIGQQAIQVVLNEGRRQVEQSTQKLVQETLDTFESGIEVREVQLQKVDVPEEVVDAFRDVQRARADKERMRNEAESYANSVVPVSQGQAAKMVQEAEAYREQVIKEAEGAAKRFLSVYEAYQRDKDIYTERLYLETLEQILQKQPKIIIDQEQGQGVVPYLPLSELKKQKTEDTSTSKDKGNN